MSQAILPPARKDMETKADVNEPTSNKVNVELRFLSEYCSISGNPLCSLKITLKATEDARISLNRTRPIIEFLEAKDDNSPGGLPLLSFYDATSDPDQPIFSYQLDVCYERDRQRLMQKDSHGAKPDDYIILSSGGYTVSHCVNLPWSYIFTYHQISKLRTQRSYRLRVGLHGQKRTEGIWYPKDAVEEVQHVHLELALLSKPVVQLID